MLLPSLGRLSLNTAGIADQKAPAPSKLKTPLPDEKREAKPDQTKVTTSVLYTSDQIRAIFSKVLEPIGVDQVFERFVANYQLTMRELYKVDELQLGRILPSTQEVTTNRSVDAAIRRRMNIERGLPHRDPVKLLTQGLEKIKATSDAYKAARDDPTRVTMTSDDKEAQKTQWNELRALKSAMLQSGLDLSDEALDLPMLRSLVNLQMSLTAANNATLLLSHYVAKKLKNRRPVGTFPSLTTFDQALRSWLRTELDEFGARVEYDPQTLNVTIKVPYRNRFDLENEVNLRLLAMMIAKHKTNKELELSRLVRFDSRIVVRDIHLIGWHIPLPIQNAPSGFATVVESLRTTLQGQQLPKQLPEWHMALCDAVLLERSTRQLGAVVRSRKGIDGVEFGTGSQNCLEMQALLAPLERIRAQLPGKFQVFPKMINLMRNARTPELDAFKDSSDVAAVVLWGYHARVLFKTKRADGSIEVHFVDPWKAAGQARPPKVVEEVFGSRANWVARAPEQLTESSCTYIALMRALVIANAATVHSGSSPEELRSAMLEAAKSSIMQDSVCLYMTALVRLLIVTRNPKMLYSESW
jgi:hypothetical protein